MARPVIVETVAARPRGDGCDAGDHLDRLARAVEALGHTVVRWTSGTPLPNVPAHDVLWWGNEVPEYTLLVAQRLGLRPLWAELGWLSDRRRALQLDRAGTGGLASWAERPLPGAGPEMPVGGSPVVRADGPLLVALRYEGTPQPRRDALLTPWFRSNAEWVRYLRGNTAGLPLRLRAHPDSDPDRTRCLVEECGAAVSWSAGDLETELARARAVAVQDSSVGAIALERGLPVLCYGRQVFRRPGAVYCLGPDPEQTAAVCAELAAGRCALDRNTMAAVVAAMRAAQWPIAAADTWPRRLREEFGL